MKHSKVSVRGQTVIPQEIREELGIKPETLLVWSTRDGIITVVPISENPIRASIGILKGRGPTSADVLAERKADLQLEQRKLAKWLKKARTKDSAR